MGAPRETSILVSDTSNIAMSDRPGPSVVEAARTGEPDRYLAALLSTPAQRDALLALAAFSAELANIPRRVVHEPAMGEIRLQWWRDALAMPAAIRTGHPVADAVREAANRHELPAGLLETLIDGRLLLLSRGVPLDDGASNDLLWKTEGALFALGARVVGLLADAELDAACAAAGRAYGMARLLLGLPGALAQGIVPLAKSQLDATGVDVGDLLSGTADAGIVRLIGVNSAQIRRNLAVARQYTSRLPRARRVAFLPLALVQPYLRVLARSGTALLREEAGVAPLTRVCRVAAAHVFGRS
jgi:15-cis-phytoene synthase